VTARFEVGQTVLLFSGLHAGRSKPQTPKPVTITRVGRKNAYITQYGRDVPFNMETGQEVRGQNVPGLGDWIRTEEEAGQEARREAAVRKLRAYGLGVSSTTDLPLTKLEALVAVRDGPPDPLQQIEDAGTAIRAIRAAQTRYFESDEDLDDGTDGSDQ
jgi:hypothetical protein